MQNRERSTNDAQSNRLNKMCKKPFHRMTETSSFKVGLKQKEILEDVEFGKINLIRAQLQAQLFFLIVVLKG